MTLKLLQRYIHAATRGPYAWAAVANSSHADGVLAEVVPYHLLGYIDLFELLPSVDVDRSPDHLWEYDHVPRVCPQRLIRVPAQLLQDYPLLCTESTA